MAGFVAARPHPLPLHRRTGFAEREARSREAAGTYSAHFSSALSRE